MSEQARDAIIVNTHFAPHGWYLGSQFKLTGMTEHEGLPGRWLSEHEVRSTEELEKLKWASWENQRSFWPTKEALLHAINEAGFDLAFEQFDTLGHILGNSMSKETRQNHRGVFVGLRTKPGTL